jgi:origin recognition complex subunit 4
MPPSATTRKRTRPANTDDLPSGKKARLAATPSTTVDAPNSSAVASTGRRGRSASGTKAAVAAQSFSSVYDLPPSDDETQPQNTPTKKPRRSPRSVYDVPESDDELSTPVVENIQSPRRSAGQASAKSSTIKRRGRPRKTSGTETAEPPKDELASSKTNDLATERIGRTTKVQEVDTSETAEDELAPATISGSKTVANGSASRSRRKSAKAAENTETESPRDAARAVKPTKKPSIWELRRAATRGALSSALAPNAPAVPEQTEPETSTPNATPSGRKRYADKEPGGETPQLKGILTPSRKDGTPRTRKSVAFDSGGNKGQEVFFEDLPNKSTGKKAIKSPKELPKTVAAEVTHDEDAVDQDGDVEMQEDDDEEEEEEVCSICKKPHSKPPNEIIFCDGCDMAVHQKCYNVPTIPEGDWLCRSCSQEDALVSQAIGHGKTSLPLAKKIEQAPDIPDFEKHLKLVQMVLIDRCTGRRRIPLRGQDEAYGKTFQLVEQTVLAGEGNSMLVIGARGSGKTTVSY